MTAMIEMPTGKKSPFPNPWTARKKISSFRFWLRPEARNRR